MAQSSWPTPSKLEQAQQQQQYWSVRTPAPTNLRLGAADAQLDRPQHGLQDGPPLSEGGVADEERVVVRHQPGRQAQVGRHDDAVQLPLVLLPVAVALARDEAADSLNHMARCARSGGGEGRWFSKK